MKQLTIQKAAAQFGVGEALIEPLGEGLIHRTYKINFPGNDVPIVLQCINQTNFPQPENIINNYRIISQYLKYQTHSLQVPEMVLTNTGKLFWIDEEGNFWRGTMFLNNTYTPSSLSDEKEARLVAGSFAGFTLSLAGLNAEQLEKTIPDFHNLSFRFQQFETAIKKASIQRLLKSTHVIAELRQRRFLVDFYESIKTSGDYKTRVMHHDCKISNILFDKTTKQAICVVDLDTTMPGYYFSDVGDMIRTMACTVDENSTRWEDIDVRKRYYNSIVNGYMDLMQSSFTSEEKTYIHHAGLLLTYMQSLRFVTDFLNNDIYYKTDYPEQNLNRALNQLILLEKTEEFLQTEYHYNSFTS
ncbi:MAG: phosphotransferase [Chitinophagaceae bacterium]|nr:phosphotransferase [Chitinophagaceae bacterium]